MTIWGFFGIRKEGQSTYKKSWKCLSKKTTEYEQWILWVPKIVDSHDNCIYFIWFIGLLISVGLVLD